VLLRPELVPSASRGWVPLLTGVALAESLRAATSVDAWLKWPNDVLAGGAKLAGILAEQAGGAIVVGAGINVSATRDELPVPGATSLALAGAACLDRHRLLAGMLAELEFRYRAWVASLGDAEECGLRKEYRGLCSTLGRQVRVEMPGGHTLTGEAADVDGDGRLLVRSDSGVVAVGAGDVAHVR
jgi:BirA family biotin operon repressor/biotin-[acetyl-CoA-carboxylase] ligase